MNKSLIVAAAIETALSYVLDPAHGDKYVFPITLPNGAGEHGATKRLALAIVDREVLADRIRSRKALETKFLKVEDNVLKVNSLTEQTIRFTFGTHFVTQELGEFYSTYVDLPLDPSECAGKRARTFEKKACKALNAIWTGGLSKVQIDGVVKVLDADGNEVKVKYEVKGLKGRITAFDPSELDAD